MQISVVIPIQIIHPVFGIYIRNLEYCLDALSQVEHPGYPMDIVVSDLGSSSLYRSKIDGLCTKYACNHIYTQNQFEWNRSKALNAGIHAAKGERIFFVDADCVVPKSYFMKHLQHAKRGNYITNLVYDLDATSNPSSNYSQLIKQKWKNRGCGWSQLSVAREVFDNVAWFDESYKLWGAEEDDWILNIESAGIQRVILDIHPIHLYHPQYVDIMDFIGLGTVCRQQINANQGKYFAKVKAIKHG